MKSKLRLDEVAEEFDVTRRTVERWIKSGELESVKIIGARRCWQAPAADGMNIKSSYHVRDIAEMWDVSTRTVHRLIETGELRVHDDKFGRKRISHEALQDFEASHKSIPQDDPYPRAKNTPEQTAGWLLEHLGAADSTLSGAEFLRLKQPVVYAWVRDEAVLYVGMSRLGLARAIGTHHVLSIFQETDQLLLWHFATWEEAAKAERDLILTVKPVYNNLRI